MRRNFGQRVQALEAYTPEQRWLSTEGLAALLRHAQQYPSMAFDVADLAEESQAPTGLQRLLKEARGQQR